MATPMSFKKNYRCSPAFQQFYTGGPVAVSSDGLFLVCACNDRITIVNSSNASLIATLEGDTELITALTLSPDDKLLFSASHSRQIRVWDLSTFKCQRSWKAHDGPVMGMACDSSGGLLATAGADRKVLVWDVDGGYCTHYFKGHKGVVKAIIFHPDPNRLFLFSGSDDATVRVWDLVSKKCTAVLEKHFSAVTSLAISENGWTLLSAGRDKVVNIWDLHNYSFISTVLTYEVLETVCVIRTGTGLAACLGKQLQSNGNKKSTGSPPNYFLTIGERGCIRIWNSEGAICLYEQRSSDTTVFSDKEDLKRGFVSAVILPSDQGLLCVTADQQFLFYCPMKSDEADFQLILSRRLVGYNEEILDLKFLGEEEQFLAVATNLEQVRVYDLASMTCSYVLTGHSDIVLCLDSCVSGFGRTFLVTGSKDNIIRLWDVERRCCVGIATGHLGAVGAVAFSKKHRNFFVSGSCDRTLKVWVLDGLSENASEPINLKSKAAVAAHTKDINSLAVSPNDSLVCSGSQDHTACIWTLPELKSVVILRGHKRGIWSVEFSPVDKCVITASGDKTIKLWSIPDGSCLRTFEGHTSSVLRASFLTRGAQFVSSGADGLLKLWTVKSNECIATFDHHEDKVWALAVGKKTEMMATGGSDAIVNLWYDSTAADKEEALLKDEEEVLKNQEMENALSDADYLKAIQIAFELRRPHKLLELFSGLFRKGQAEDQIETALRALGKEEIRVVLEYVREWNTKPKFCHVAHFVLFRVFNIIPPTELIEIKGIGELLEGLLPYSQRHFSRIDRLVRSTLLLDYTLSAMSVISPEAGPLESNDRSAPPSNDELINDLISENGIMEQKQSSLDSSMGKKLSKKRKSSKSRGTVEKKVKKAYTEVSAMPLAA